MRADRAIENASSDDVCSIICNPIYTGMGGFPQAISDEQWIKAATIAMKIDSKHHFLMNLSSSLESSFGFQLIGRGGWTKEIEVMLEKHDVKKVLADLLDFLKEFFKKEVVNKNIGKYYKKWRITSPIPVVIRQIINNLHIILYIRVIESSNFAFINVLSWFFKSSKGGSTNPPILEFESFLLHVKK